METLALCLRTIHRGWLRLIGRRLAGRPDTARLGARGEKLACRHLRRLGYRLLRKNFRCTGGEVDLIMQDGPEVVFVEVKTRRNEDYIATEKVVNTVKQQHIRTAARHFLRRYKLGRYQARYDIVAVIWPPGAPPRVRHTIRAF